MTEAEKWLKNQATGKQGASITSTRRMPAERYLGKTEVRGVGNERDVPHSGSSTKIGLRVLAVVVFLLLFFVATYFAKVAYPPRAFLGCWLGVISFMVGGALWRSGGTR